MEKSDLAPMMVGFEYVLVEEGLAEYLEALNLPRLTIANAILYDPRSTREIRTHRQLLIDQRFFSNMIRDIDLDGERLLLMDNRYVFVSPLLKERLERSPVQYLRFTEGLSHFASQET